MQTLEERLNHKADQELRAHVQALTKSMHHFPRALGFDGYHGTPDQWTELKTKDGNKASSVGHHARELEETLVEGFREAYRDKFRASFLAKVESMQREMESYIGELHVEQEQPA